MAYAGPPGNSLSVITVNGDDQYGRPGGYDRKTQWSLGDFMGEGLAVFNQLPESERKPKELKPQGYDYHRRSALPKGFLALKVYNRTFHLRDAQRELRRVEVISQRLSGPNGDFLWLTDTEWRSLIPASPRKGQQQPVPAAIAKRFFDCLVDTTDFCQSRGFGDVRASELTLTVDEVSAAGVRLRMEGRVQLSDDADLAKATAHGDFTILGFLHFDAQQDALERFDVVALGDARSPFKAGHHHHQEEWQTLGVSFETCQPGTPGYGVLPGQIYFGLPLDGSRDSLLTHAHFYFGQMHPEDRRRLEEYCSNRDKARSSVK